jgi:hypothetical protein
MCPDPDKAARSQLDQCRLALLMCLGHRHGPKSHNVPQLACGDTRADQPKNVLLKALDKRRLDSSAKFILTSGCVGPVVNRTLETAEVRGQRCYLRRREFSGGKGRGEMSAFTTAGF